MKFLIIIFFFKLKEVIISHDIAIVFSLKQTYSHKENVVFASWLIL